VARPDRLPPDLPQIPTLLLSPLLAAPTVHTDLLRLLPLRLHLKHTNTALGFNKV
jgi:hypothetical protein